MSNAVLKHHVMRNIPLLHYFFWKHDHWDDLFLLFMQIDFHIVHCWCALPWRRYNPCHFRLILLMVIIFLPCRWVSEAWNYWQCQRWDSLFLSYDKILKM